MFAWLRNIFARSEPSPIVKAYERVTNEIRARYEAALNTDENKRKWQQVDFLSARAANSPAVRGKLRARARHVVANNSYAFGIVNTKVGHMIGTGPVPQFRTGDEGADKQIQTSFLEWADEVGFVEKLTTTATAKMGSGEGVLIHKTNKRLFHSVKLYPQDIECDQVTTPELFKMSDVYLDGITLDSVGNPIKYTVLKWHPGDFLFPNVNPLQHEEVRADKLILWFRKDRPGQVRGIPELTPALDLFEDIRSFRMATLSTAELQACHTLFIKNLSGMGASANVEGFENTRSLTSFDVDRGLATLLPTGYEPHQLDPKQPGATFEMFIYCLLGEACRCIRVPLNIALGTSQKFNFSSARLDHLDYRDDLKVERRRCEAVVLNPLTRAWLEEAADIPEILPSGLSPEQVKVKWRWPGWSFMDPQKDALADSERLLNKTMSYERYYAERGEDWEEEFEQMGAEQDLADKLGITLGGKTALSTQDQVGNALDEQTQNA